MSRREHGRHGRHHRHQERLRKWVLVPVLAVLAALIASGLGAPRTALAWPRGGAPVGRPGGNLGPAGEPAVLPQIVPRMPPQGPPRYVPPAPPQYAPPAPPQYAPPAPPQYVPPAAPPAAPGAAHRWARVAPVGSTVHDVRHGGDPSGSSAGAWAERGGSSMQPHTTSLARPEERPFPRLVRAPEGPAPLRPSTEQRVESRPASAERPEARQGAGVADRGAARLAPSSSASPSLAAAGSREGDERCLKEPAGAVRLREGAAASGPERRQADERARVQSALRAALADVPDPDRVARAQATERQPPANAAVRWLLRDKRKTGGPPGLPFPLGIRPSRGGGQVTYKGAFQ
jgi:hypothetical protein